SVCILAFAFQLFVAHPLLHSLPTRRSSDLPRMSDDPLLVYVSLGIGVILLIVQAVPKVLGPIGTAMQDWTRTRREARIESRQADLVDIQRQVEYLTEARKADRGQHERARAGEARDVGWV